MVLLVNCFKELARGVASGQLFTALYRLRHNGSYTHNRKMRHNYSPPDFSNKNSVSIKSYLSIFSVHDRKNSVIVLENDLLCLSKTYCV